jgi:L-tyrosine isonitrile synthase
MNAVVSDTQVVSNAILDALFQRRRLLEDAAGPDAQSSDSPSEVAERAPHLEKISALVNTRQPIDMILPAFPGKSPNRKKTLGYLPDLAERHSLANLHAMLQQIGAIYQPGAVIKICSDGFVFGDLVRIPDQRVKNYVDELQRHTTCCYGKEFDYFDLVDAYPDLTSMEARREEMLIEFAEPLRLVRQRCGDEREAAAMYCGITRFLYEDYLGLKDFASWSKTRIQQHARTIAYRVIQRSNAWSELLARRFPHALRLSIHPQSRTSRKIGINMIATDDNWRTPWHSVAILHAEQIRLERRSEINEDRVILVFQHGRPSHYRVAMSQSEGAQA